MNSLTTFARTTFARSTLICCLFLFSLFILAACVARRFTVIPQDPSYLLQTPNANRVAFPDVLKAFNGFQAGSGRIDLRSLMELRVENAYYEPGASRTGLKGYLGTEVARYAISTDGLQLLSVTPMVDRPAQDKPVQLLIPASEEKFKFYRLYYEIVFAGSNNSHGSVLLGGNSTNELDQLSDQLSHPESICHPAATHCTVFPEACSVSVEMKIRLNGKTQTLVWGTILGNLVKSPHYLVVKRLYKTRLISIRIDFHDPKALLLPLLPGDEIFWG